MKRAVALAVVLGVLGCNGVSTQEAFERVSVMTYIKDARTGLCFAVLFWLGETRSATNVPCTPEVENLIARTP